MTDTIAGRNGHGALGAEGTLSPLGLGGDGLTGPVSGLAAEEVALLERFGDLVDTRTGAIGRVVGSEKEPAGAHRFCMWADDDARSLDVGHVVVAFSEEAAVIGVVDEPRRFSDLRTFLDDYFDRHVERALAEELATRRPEILVFCVDVLATKHLRSDVTSHRPPVAGAVYFATPAAIDYALGRQDFSGVAIPALMHTNGNAARDADGAERRDAAGNVVFQRAPVWVDGDYLLGPEAGHANWTGQSGLATKTSHALFLTSAVFQKLRAQGESVAALMFNVKGPDLLWLDKSAEPGPGEEAAYAAAGARGLREEDRDAYAALGLEPRPFAPFRVFAPFKPGHDPSRPGQTAVYLERERYHGALNTLRDAPAETAGVVYPILWNVQALLRQPHKVFDRGDLDDKLWGFIYELRERQIESMNQLDTLFGEIAAHFEADPSASDWHGHHKFTINKARNRIRALPDKLGGLLARSAVQYGNLPKVDDPFEDQELRVVDIANCNTVAQELIVSAVINKVWKMAEEEKLQVKKLIVFVDELNKYAPGGGEGGLRDTLVDIAARGRHLNVVLFGAQQFRSKVDDEILGNCGTSLYGRVGDEEITNSAYRSLSETAKAELLGLPKGRLLVRHAHFRAPLFGTFPFPPTVAGMAGQRVFNGGRAVATAGNSASGGSGSGNGDGPVVGTRAVVPIASANGHGHPADGIWKMLVRHLGEDRAPRKAEVRTLADGLDPATLNEICSKVDQTTLASRGKVGYNPWRIVQSDLSRAKARGR